MLGLDSPVMVGCAQVGVIPLGTGNDLARVFGWGGGYSGEDLKKLMKKFAKAKTMLLDR